MAAVPITAAATARASATAIAKPPTSLTVTATARAQASAAVGTLVWSGRTWTRRPDQSGQAPGPNNWKAANVSVVGADVLRLAITQQAGSWYCAELDGVDHLGYGRYRFVVNSDLSAVDPNVVLGVFTYDSSTTSPFREIDIELYPVGDQFNSAFTVQPAAEVQTERFSFNNNPPYTCDFVWQAGQVYFVVTDTSGQVLHRHVVNDGVQVPGNEVVVLNAWLIGGVAPAAPLSLDIASFAFTPGVTFTAPAVGTYGASFASAPADIYLHGSASISGGSLAIPCTAAYAAYAEGEHIYSLIGSSLSIQVKALPAVGTGTTEARFYAYHDANNYLLASKSGPSILFRKCEAGVNTDNYVTYAAGMTYWRLTESGGNVLFQTSPDCLIWTTHYTVPHTMGSKLSNVRLRLQAGYYGTESAPGPFLVGGVNPLPPTYFFSDDFSTYEPDYTKWGSGAVHGAVAQTDAGLVIPCAFNGAWLVPTAYGANLQGAAHYARIDQTAGGVSGISMFALLRSDNFQLDFQVKNGTLTAGHTPASGGRVLAASATYSPTAHLWWQIRESGGTVFWEVSADGSTWTAFASWGRGAEAVVGLRPEFWCGYTDSTPGNQGTGQMVVRFYNQLTLRDRSPGALTETFDALPTGTIPFGVSYRDWRTIDDGGGGYVSIAGSGDQYLSLSPPAGVDVTVRDDLRHPPATIDLTFTLTVVSEVGTDSTTVIHWGMPVASNNPYPRYEVVISATNHLVYAQQRLDATTTQTLGVAPLPVNTALGTAYSYRLQAIGSSWALSRDHGSGTPLARLLTGVMPSASAIGHVGFTAYQATVQVNGLEISSGVPIEVELAGPPIAQRTWGAYVVVNTPGTAFVDPTVSGHPEWITTMFKRIGGTPQIASWSATSDWSTIPDAALQWSTSGLANLVAWPLAAPLTATGIQGGSLDPQMLLLCAAIDALPTPTWIRLGPKMNVSTSPVRGVASTPSAYIGMWRYIVTFMRGLTSKVRFIFNPAREDSPITDPALEKYFPGDAYLDAVGFDAFNFGNDGGAGAHSWETHAEAYRLIYDRLRALTTKDIWVCETSSKETLASDAYTADGSGNYTVAVPTGPTAAPVDPSHSKGQWIRDLLTETGFPRVTTIVWYSVAAARDWRYDSSADSLAGFMDGFAATAPGERVVLDPVEMSDNASFDITAFVASAGPDWGDATIQQVVAEAGVEGQLPIDYTIPNRTITVPLALQDRAGVAFHDARRFIQQKVALFMAQGGWVKRHTSWGDVYAEIVNAQLKLGGSSMQAMLDVDVDAQLVLTTLPPWLGLEQDLGTLNGLGEVDIITDNPIDGNLPGRMRIRVTDTSGSDQLGVIWAVRARNLIDPTIGTIAATNEVAYEAEDLTPSGLASRQSFAGASGPLAQVVRYPSVPRTTDVWNPAWQAVLATTLADGHDMTHVGSQRIWARAFIEGGTASTLSTSRLRFRAEVGDLLLGAANAPTAVLKFGGFYLLDLGVIRLDKAPVGNHRWQGHVEAMNTTGIESVSIDKLWVIPVQEGAGALRSLDPNVLYDGQQVSDAVVFANQNAELRSDGLWRLSRSGAGYGPVQRPQGPLPKLPASGMEQRPVEVFIKTSRGTLDESVSDAGVDPLTVNVVYQAAYLYVS